MNVKSSAELRRELEAAETRERAALAAKRAATRPEFEYWVTPVAFGNEGRFSFGKVYDPTCHLYEIRRECSNRDAALAAGWQEDEIREGSAIYLFNIVTRRIICAVGGGTLYIGPNGQDDGADDTAMFAIGGYLAEYPGGGMISWVVDDFKTARRNANEVSAKVAANGHKA